LGEGIDKTWEGVNIGSKVVNVPTEGAFIDQEEEGRVRAAHGDDLRKEVSKRNNSYMLKTKKFGPGKSQHGGGRGSQRRT
jgi:hypothetical protein